MPKPNTIEPWEENARKNVFNKLAFTGDVGQKYLDTVVLPFIRKTRQEAYEDGYADALQDGTKTCNEMVNEARQEAVKEYKDKLAKKLVVSQDRNHGIIWTITDNDLTSIDAKEEHENKT